MQLTSLVRRKPALYIWTKAPSVCRNVHSKKICGKFLIKSLSSSRCNECCWSKIILRFLFVIFRDYPCGVKFIYINTCSHKLNKSKIVLSASRDMSNESSLFWRGGSFGKTLRGNYFVANISSTRCNKCRWLQGILRISWDNYESIQDKWGILGGLGNWPQSKLVDTRCNARCWSKLQGGSNIYTFIVTTPKWNPKKRSFSSRDP